MPASWCAALFAKLRAIYGEKWSDRYPAERDIEIGMAEWGEALHDLTGEEIRYALDWCRDKRLNEWPPPIPEFRMIAKQASTTLPAHSAFPELPKPDPDSEVVKQALADMRQALGMASR